MTDIVEFLNARLDEDEAAAVRAARPEPWVKPQPPRPDWYVQFWADERDRAAVVADPESSAYPIVSTLGHDGNDEADEELAEGRVEHIARHDPARVLADVAAKRKLLWEIHAITISRPDGAPDEGLLDRPAGRLLQAMASAYADHEDFDPTWRLA